MAAPHLDLTSTIETLVSERPEEIRAQAVEAMRAAVPSHFGMFVKCTEATSGEWFFTGLVTDGDEEVIERVDQFTDAPVLQCPWMPPHVDPAEMNRFLRIRTFYDYDYQTSFEAERVIWQPLETGDQLRVIVCDGTQLLGWIGLVRRGIHHRFTAAEEQTLQRALGSIKSALTAAEALESRGLEDELFAVFRPDGTVEHACRSFGHWLDADRQDHLRQRIRRFDRGSGGGGVEVLAGAETRLVRLDGASGVRYLLTVDRAELMRFRPQAWLTDRQLEVAEFAVAGATNGEIADTLGITTNTVKAHLKNIYRRLGVSSRVELAEQLRDA